MSTQQLDGSRSSGSRRGKKKKKRQEDRHAEDARELDIAAQAAVDREAKKLLRQPSFRSLFHPITKEDARLLQDPGQSFSEYHKDAIEMCGEHGYRPSTAGKERREKIYIQPIGSVSDFVDLDALAAQTSAFYFGMDVVVAPSWDIVVHDGADFVHTPDGYFDLKTRIRPAPAPHSDSGAEGIQRKRAKRIPRQKQKKGAGMTLKQYNLNTLADAVLYNLPKDAFCRMGICMLDMYEEEEDAFCMGRAWGASHGGVIGIYRYQLHLLPPTEHERRPLSPASSPSSTPLSTSTSTSTSSRLSSASTTGRTAETAITISPTPRANAMSSTSHVLSTKTGAQDASRHILTARSAKTMIHELGHCFLFDHCTAYTCLMNGTYSLDEDLDIPCYFCPIDLMKLMHACTPLLVNKEPAATAKSLLASRYEALIKRFQFGQGMQRERAHLEACLAQIATTAKK